MMYEHTKCEDYLSAAKDVELQLDEALHGLYELLHHDVGFMWHILSGTLYRVTGDEASKNRALTAAATLVSRLNIDGRYITAWNGVDRQNLTIIDTMMNLPLLYWASRETKDDRFARVAKMHADMAYEQHLRPDGSVNHMVEHNRETGAPLSYEELPVGRYPAGALAPEYGGQGYCYGSSWTRGQGWAVYGFTLAYIHTGDQKYLDAARKVANYIIANLCDDWLPVVDFRAPAEPVYYDSTAGTIFACAFIELAKILPENEGGMYMNAAIKTLQAMEKAFSEWDEEKDFIIGCGSIRYPQSEGMKKLCHIPIIYADYYFTEAILKLRGSEFLTW
jgi:unsaturated chondroitin disaccharide hydrolase